MSLLYTLIGILAYVLLTCWTKKLNVVDYIQQNKAALLLTGGVVLLIQMFGNTATAAVLMAVLTPMLAAYSLPSLFAKAKEIINRLFGLNL